MTGYRNAGRDTCPQGVWKSTEASLAVHQRLGGFQGKVRVTA